MVTRRYGRNLRGMTFWLWNNVAPGVMISAILLLILAAGGETYLRVSTPFTDTVWPGGFDSRTGFIFKPGAEVATTNNFDYWTRQRANSVGFLDREPVPPEQRAGGCHLIFIGDSFVEAHQVTVDRKAQVVFERLARERLPALMLTAAAYGQSDTGQINQLPIYDHFARREKPKIVVLVVVKNDFSDNSVVLQAINHGRDPDHMPRLFARRTKDGGFELQPIDPNWSKYVLTPQTGKPPAYASNVNAWLKRQSLVYRWVEQAFWRITLFFERKLYGQASVAGGQNPIAEYAQILAQRPQYAYV
ncbi:MAG: hypothetical protein HY659_06400, partial [Rhizobiales bacterium]|nr:hypothetical protein [Hyphomicrobiales bacterium]